MAETKTRPTGKSVPAFIATIESEQRRRDARTLLAMMKRITGEPAKMWGPSIVGFGTYHYKYASGHEGDTCIAAFSPRSTALTVYLVPGFTNSALMGKLGKVKTGKSCLYISRLGDVDQRVLEQLIVESVRWVAAQSALATQARGDGKPKTKTKAKAKPAAGTPSARRSAARASVRRTK